MGPWIYDSVLLLNSQSKPWGHDYVLMASFLSNVKDEGRKAPQKKLI